MSTIGVNHFILEKDEPGFYWYLLDLIKALEGLENKQNYEIGTLNGVTYILIDVFEAEESIEYQIAAKMEGAQDKFIAVSYINPDEIYMEEGVSNDKEGKYFRGFGRLTSVEDLWNENS